MGHTTGKFIAVVLTAGLLGLPAGLSAKQRWGADLIVTRLDGSQASGELITVKPGSLLLLDAAGHDENIALAEIVSVRIVRKSKAGLFAGLGGAAGAIGGIIWGSADPELQDQGGVLLGIGIFGGSAALAGLALGAVKGIDTTFVIADEPEATVQAYWRKLQAYSREGRLKGRPTQLTAPRSRRQPPAAPSVPPPPLAAPAERRPSRWDLKLSGQGHFGTMSGSSFGDASFRVLGETGSGQGPHDATFRQWNSSGSNGFAGLALGLRYFWRERLAVEIELFDLGSSTSGVEGELRYVSAADSLTYTSYFYRNLRARFTGLLAGLAFRSARPTAFRRHILEFGAAAGPTLVRGIGAPFNPEGIPNPMGQTVILSGRAQAAYDFYLYQSLSLGAFAGFRFMGTTITGISASGIEPFFEEGIPGVDANMHLTEIFFPDLPVRASGLYWGLRLGFRL